ncbi:RIP metalloprotease RseP [Thermanaerosceptrum fracticalcis]|nr:RIP metalloprotease RseP [Thermanaerosceptrum fracticalcis]
MQTLIASILVFGMIIFVHELGHFLVAKAAGIRVEEFSLGMGPKITSARRGETLYSLRVLPIGGYVKMAGEMGEEETAGYDPRKFNQKPLLARMAVIIAGPLMNFALAALLFAAVFTVVGIPQITTNIGQVIANSPAEAAGLKAGDKITHINEKPMSSWNEMVEVIHASPEKKIKLTVVRENKTLNIEVVPKYDPEGKVGIIGITPDKPYWARQGIWAGIKGGIVKTYEITALTISALVQMIAGKASAEGLTGPIGIVQLIDESARVGLVYLTNLTAVISINLGLLNLLPIPALDGSRLFFLFIEGLRGRPINPSKENFVHLIGFALLMLLMVLVTYRDLLRFFG